MKRTSFGMRASLTVQGVAEVFNGYWRQCSSFSSCLCSRRYFVPVYDPHMGNCYTFLSGGEGRPKLYVSEPNAWQDKKGELTTNRIRMESQTRAPRIHLVLALKAA